MQALEQLKDTLQWGTELDAWREAEMQFQVLYSWNEGRQLLDAYELQEAADLVAHIAKHSSIAAIVGLTM